MNRKNVKNKVEGFSKKTKEEKIKWLKENYFNNNSKIIFPNIPTFIVKAFFGEMSELVLSSQKVKSQRLNNYVFKFSKLDLAIKDLSTKI